MAGYKKLYVYQKAYQLVLKIYQLTENLPKEKQYGLKSQIRRAATSIPLNIAEGYGKIGGKNETLRYLAIARGSSCEMDVLLNLLRDLEYISEGNSKEMLKAYEEVGKMLTGLMQSITNS